MNDRQLDEIPSRVKFSEQPVLCLNAEVTRLGLSIIYNVGEHFKNK